MVPLLPSCVPNLNFQLIILFRSQILKVFYQISSKSNLFFLIENLNLFLISIRQAKQNCLISEVLPTLSSPTTTIYADRPILRRPRFAFSSLFKICYCFSFASSLSLRSSGVSSSSLIFRRRGFEFCWVETGDCFRLDTF